MPENEPVDAETTVNSRPAEAANSPKRSGGIYDEDGIPNAGATAFVIFLLPFLAAIATFITCFVMFWPKK